MRIRALAIVLPLLAPTLGCSGGRDVADKQIDALRAEIVKLRAEQGALAERLDNVELARGPRGGPPAPTDTPTDRPALDILRLGPDGEGDPDGKRPVLRSTGPSTVIEDPSGAPRSDGDDPRPGKVRAEAGRRKAATAKPFSDAAKKADKQPAPTAERP